MSTACYIRVSSEDQAEKHGLDVQKQQISAYFTARGWPHPAPWDWFVDAETGRKQDRRAFMSFLDKAKRGDYERLVFTKIDRLARDDQLFIKLAMELEGLGVQLVCIQQPFDSGTLFGRFIMKQMALLAWWEVENIRERTLAGHHLAVKQKGKTWGSRPPFGYTTVPGQPGALEPEPAEAEVVRKIFAMKAAGGRNNEEIALELDLGGWPTRKGGPWSGTMIWKILRREAFYRGMGASGRIQPEDGVAAKHPAILEAA